MNLPSLAQSPGFIVSDRAEAFAANLEYLLRIRGLGQLVRFRCNSRKETLDNLDHDGIFIS